MFGSATPAGSLRSDAQLDQNAVFERNIQMSSAQMFSFAWQNICLLIFTPFQTCFHTREMFAFCFVFFGENTRKKRSNILFFQVWKWVNRRNRFFFFLVGKKESEFFFFFFFYVWVVKHVFFLPRVFCHENLSDLFFFPICENSHTKKNKKKKKKIRQTRFFHAWNQKQVLADEKKSCVINKT